MRIALLNPNTNAATTALMVDIASTALPRGWTATGHTAADGAALITTPLELRRAAAAVAAMGRVLPPCDGAIVAAFGDPGLAALKATLKVPVVGIGEAAMAQAAMHGPFAVATTTPRLAGAIRQQAATYGHHDRLTETVLTEGDTRTLMDNPRALESALARAIDRAVRGGQARAVIVGGGPLARAARALADQVSVALIEPIPAAVHVLAQHLSPGGEPA